MIASRTIPSVVRSSTVSPYRSPLWTDDELVQLRLFLDVELANLDLECEDRRVLEPTRAHLLADRQMVTDELHRRQRARQLPGTATDRKPYWEAIKARVTALDLYDRHFPAQPLRRTGRGWRGACPICGERDPDTRERPAFSVSDDGRLWHCFRCLEGGDVFTLGFWLYNNRNLPAVADAIAAEFGIKRPSLNQTHTKTETEMIPSRPTTRESRRKGTILRRSQRPRFEIRGGKVVPS